MCNFNVKVLKLLKLLFIPFLITIAFQTSYAVQQDSIKNTDDDASVLLSKCSDILDSAKIYAYSDLKKAITKAKIALKIAKEANNDSIIAESKSLLGSCYTKLGAYSEALEYLLEALQYYENNDSKKGKITILKRIGDLLWYNGKFNQALEYYENFGAYASQIHDTLSVISSYISKGAVYGNTNNLDTAILLFDKALKLSIALKNDYREMLCRFNIADVLLHSGKPNQAIIKFNEIRYEFEKNNKPYHNKSGIYNSLAEANLKVHDFNQANKYNQLAFKLAKEGNQLLEILNFYEIQYKIDSAQKNYTKAFLNHVKYKKLNDSIKSQQLQEYLADFKMRYDLDKGQMEIDKLQLKNEINQNQLKRNRYFFISGTIVIILLLTLIQNVFRSRKKLNIKNKKLDEQKEELETTLEQLKQTQTQLVQSEKMASLGLLTTGIAHEINNPLNYINGGIYILEDIRSEFDPENIHEFREKFDLALKMVEDGFNKSSSIVKSLMSFATRESRELEKHNLTTILNNTLIFIKPQLENITVETDYTENDELLIYPDKLHQVLINIFDNTIKALADVEEKKIKIATQKNKNFFTISIQNNGPQIAKKDLDRLFDPFFTTRQPGEGVGMGLTISYNLIKEHNGEIKARNLTEGVEFLIELPV